MKFTWRSLFRELKISGASLSAILSNESTVMGNPLVKDELFVYFQSLRKGRSQFGSKAKIQIANRSIKNIFFAISRISTKKVSCLFWAKIFTINGEMLTRSHWARKWSKSLPFTTGFSVTVLWFESIAVKGIRNFVGRILYVSKIIIFICGAEFCRFYATIFRFLAGIRPLGWCGAWEKYILLVGLKKTATIMFFTKSQLAWHTISELGRLKKCTESKSCCFGRFLWDNFGPRTADPVGALAQKSLFHYFPPKKIVTQTFSITAPLVWPSIFDNWGVENCCNSVINNSWPPIVKNGGPDSGAVVE